MRLRNIYSVFIVVVVIIITYQSIHTTVIISCKINYILLYIDSNQCS